ncbi:MAG TPA: hypothetical protein VFE08_15165 [Candidatus Sulfotelmatobacter sp.]|jgi:hypothetical protein|nr:hypothetical protein [Candidatus Sulfotelmatobacter sp.]
MGAYGLTAPCGETPMPQVVKKRRGGKSGGVPKAVEYQKRQGRLSATPGILTK